MRRPALFLSLVVTLACAAYFVSAASATPPQRFSFTSVGTFVVSAGDLCSFDVQLDFVVDVNQTNFFDAAGNRTMAQQHTAEQDTFSANGKSLVSEVYHAFIQGFFDENGDLTKLVVDGVLIRVPLPGGGVFIGAGRVDSFGNFALFPNHGAYQNVEGFCAALSP
jgi:hypothetical protein